MNGTVCLSVVAGLVTGCLDLMNTCRLVDVVGLSIASVVLIDS